MNIQTIRAALCLAVLATPAFAAELTLTSGVGSTSSCLITSTTGQ